MGKVYVIGVGMTKFEKPEKINNHIIKFGKEALENALADAKIPYTEIEQAFVSCVYARSTYGQRVLYEVGMTGIPIINVNNNCASGSSALLLAKQAIEYGVKDCVLALGFEKMKKGPLRFNNPRMTSPLKRQFVRLFELCEKSEAPITTIIFGNIGIEHMKKYGSTKEHFAKIAYKNHKHGSMNPYVLFLRNFAFIFIFRYSMLQKAYTLQEILNSREMKLTKLQCCSPTDGGAAAIVASERFVIKYGLQRQAVEILGMEMATDLSSTFTDNSVTTLSGSEMTKLAAYRVYQKTKIHATEVDVVELHDCFSTHELVLYELLGLCPPGNAAQLIDQNDNTYGGKYVINPSGGLIGRGHPLGATGLAQCVELCWQLRGEAGERQVQRAKLALQHNYGWGGASIVGLYSLGFRIQSLYEDPNRTDNEYTINLLIKLVQSISAILAEKKDLFRVQLKILSESKHKCWNVTVTNNIVKIEKDDGKGNSDVVFTVSQEDLSQLLRNVIAIQSSEDACLELNKIYTFVKQKISIQCKL
ncbi:hypothetical protein FQR65_LT10902 [Abscondita terminalis]|nr:hypothetical protein FQR65_LT10902 [Abscondita terminalis]